MFPFFLLSFFLSLLLSGGGENNCVITYGAITRMDTTQKAIYLVFTGHEFADGGETIAATLSWRRVPASFFLTGDFYRNPRFAGTIRRLIRDGHYLGPHSDKHLLYAAWENRDSLLVSKEEFRKDLFDNYKAMEPFGLGRKGSGFFMPPYEWHNSAIAGWSREVGVTLVNFTPGTSSNADYTTPDMGRRYVRSDSIFQRILRYASSPPSGLSGFLLLFHIGTDPRRTDKFYHKLDDLIVELARRGYRFRRLG